MNSNNLDNKYFYALTDVKEYDATIRLTVPHYDLIHKTMLDFTKWYFKYKNLDKSEGVFIDIGAGSGTEALAILKEYDKFELLAIDLSEPMKTEFIDNYNHIIGQNQPARFNYQVRDVFDIYIKQFEYNKTKVLAL